MKESGAVDTRRHRLPARHQAYLRRAIRRIVRHVGPDRIILFGSYASGNSHEGSDLDLLIVARSHKHPFDREQEVDELLWDRPVAMDILVRTPGEIAAYRRRFQPFWEEILEEGKTLYAARR